MECACYLQRKVSAIGLTPPGSPNLPSWKSTRGIAANEQWLGFVSFASKLTMGLPTNDNIR